MKCLRCGSDMNHYKFEVNWGIFGKQYNAGYGSPDCLQTHNPRSIYECDKCGYIELSTKECENEDI